MRHINPIFQKKLRIFVPLLRINEILNMCYAY